MSNLTPELNLALGVDDDDTADYLTIGLADSLQIVDGLFNQTTGHTHNGSHQGGVLQFLDFTVGENLTVVGASDLKGAVLIEQTLHVMGDATFDATLTARNLNVTADSHFIGGVMVDGVVNTAAQPLKVGALTTAGDVHAKYLYTTDASNGAVYSPDGHLYLRPKAGSQVICDQGPLAVSQWISAGSYVSAGPPLAVGAGDITANRGNNTGYIFLGNGARYLGFDGTNYAMPGTQLYVQGQQVATSDNAMTLNQKTLGDPKATGQTTMGGASYTFPTVTGNAGMWRYIKAWGQNMVIGLTNGTFILGNVQYSSGQYTLVNGDSVSCYCDGGNWWVM